MATRRRGHDDGDRAVGRDGADDGSTTGVPSGAAGRELGDGVRVVSRAMVVDGTVRHEIGLERRPGV